MLKTIINSILLCCLFMAAGAQADLPKVIPPSPEVQALFKCNEYTVNGATGVPDISIPIYEIKCGSLTVPISISYNAVGRKVYDETGPVGLGWSLNCGGMISRTVYGKPDELYRFPSSIRNAEDIQDNNSNNSDDYYYLEAIFGSKGNDYDSQYDMFSYILPGKSGKFIITKDQFGENNGTLLFPPNASQIPLVQNIFPEDIIDDTGVKYHFGLSEIARVTAPDGSYLPFSPVTARYLASITSANGEDVISFAYKQAGTTAWHRDFRTETIEVRDNYTGQANGQYQERIVNQSNEKDYFYYRTTQITFRNGRVTFELIKDENNLDTDRYKSIKVYDSNGNLIKSIEFCYSVLDASSVFNSIGYVSNYKLDGLVVRDKFNTETERYSFYYNPTDPAFNVQARDLWGFRNGTNQIALLTNTKVLTVDEIAGYNEHTIGDGADRSVRPDEIKKGVLNKIVYPTGGSTEFTYEGNKVGSSSGAMPGPGLRVATIKTTDNKGNTTLKTYDYPVDGFVKFYPDDNYNYRSTQKRVYYHLTTNFDELSEGMGDCEICYWSSYRSRVYSSDIAPELSYLLDQPIFYPGFDEYLGSKTSNKGVINYGFEMNNLGSWQSKQFYMHGSASYAQNKNCFESGSRYAYPYDPKSSNYQTDGAIMINFLNLKELCTNPVLTNKSYSANIGTDAQGNIRYAVKQSTYYNYETIQSAMLKELYIYRLCDFAQESCNRLQVTEEDAVLKMHLPAFDCANTYVSINNKQLRSVTETQDDVSTTTTYLYNDQNLVSETQKMVNGNNTIITKNAYPFDAAYSSTEPYKTMVSKNMMNYTIEQNTYKNNTSNPLQGVRTDYNFFNNNKLIAPQTLNVKKGALAYEPRLQYQQYDGAGNIAQVQKVDDVPSTYIWGYNKSYPVIEAKNVDYATLQSKVQQSLPTDYSNLDNLLVSLPAVPGNIWGDFNKRLRANLGNNVLVNTYTYTPLVGMASQTDPNGFTSYYDYDAAGRLMRVKDNDQNILKIYNYHFANSTVGVTYYNAQQSQTFTRDNCGFGRSSITQYTYTVRANTYSSAISQADADQQALNEISRNGQEAANGNCQCSDLPPTVNVPVNGLIALHYNVSITFKDSNGQTETFSLSPEESNLSVIVPQGMYNVYISLENCTGRYTFNVNGVTSVSTGSCSASFSSVNIQPGSYISIY